MSTTSTARRWEKNASALGRVLEIVALVAFNGGAIYIFRNSHVVFFGLFVVANLIIISTRWLNRSGVYELVIDDESVVWGWAGVRNKDGQLANRYVDSIQFYRRANGTGAIELRFENGTCAFLPSDLTEQPGVGDEILSKVREVMPQVPVNVL